MIADAAPRPYWLDQPAAPAPRPPLHGVREADLVVVGGGLTGLWTALLAAEEGRRVVLLEGERIAFGASGRNGGFCSASLTHGIGNGLARWPDEMAALERLGRENLDAMRATVARHGIDCGWADTGAIDVATARHQVPWLAEEAEQLRAHGWQAELLDAEAMRAQVRLTDLPRRRLVARRVRARRPGAAVLGPGARRGGGGRRGVRAHAGDGARTRRRRGARRHGRRPRARRSGRCWPRARSRRSCGRSGATSCRSTTTCW